MQVPPPLATSLGCCISAAKILRRHAGRVGVSYSDHYAEQRMFRRLMDRLRAIENCQTATRMLNNPRDMRVPTSVLGADNTGRALDGKKQVQRKREWGVAAGYALAPMLIPATSVVGAISRESQDPETNEALLYEVRRAHRRRAGRSEATAARARSLRSMRSALPGPICHAARKARSMVCLRSRAHSSG